MIKSNNTIMIVGILVGLIFTGLPCLEAQSPIGAPTVSPAGTPLAPAPAVDCITVLANVSDCLTYVQVGSNLTVPDKLCCPELAGLLESNPICLCELIGQAENYGVDLSRALMLPNACKLQTPPLAACPATPSSAPIPSPVSSPGSEAPGSTAGGPGASGETASSPGGSGGSGSNGASGTAVHDVSTIICLGVAIFIAYYF